jgi:chromosome segregation ATPase
LVASKDDEIRRLILELEESRAELPSLEGEIVVLRSDLMSVRRELDHQEAAARASEAQLERDKGLLNRAAETILELKSHFEKDPKGNGGPS